MTMHIYPQTCPDFYFRRLSQGEYAQQFDLLNNQPANRYLGFKEKEGFVYFSLIEKVIQVIKGLLGFTDYTDTHRLNAEWLKLLYVGEARKFLSPENLHALRQRISFSQPSQSVDISIRRLSHEIFENHANPSPERLVQMRGILSDYHVQQAERLRPSFWQRLSQKPPLDRRQLVHFGDSSLYLAQQALTNPVVDPQLALNFLLEAYHLKNEHPDFQNKLAIQFKHFLDTHQTHPLVTNQKTLIQQIWLGLAETAYGNQQSTKAREFLANILEDHPSEAVRQKMGKIYLIYKDYEKLESFLPSLSAQNTDVQVQIQIAQAYWHYHRYSEGVTAYKQALELLQAHTNTRSNSQMAAHINAEIGKAYLHRLEGLNHPSSSTYAIFHLLAAHRHQPEQIDYQKLLFQAYLQQWKSDSTLFATTYGREWLRLLNACDLSSIQEWQEDIQTTLLDCSEQAFSTHQSQEAHAYLQKGLELFAQEPGYILRALELSLRQTDLTSVEANLEKWEQDYYSHPFIQECIGDIYWDSNREKAIELYEEAIKLFEHRQDLSTNSDERLICQTHIAKLQAKIGTDCLQRERGLFTSPPYPEAISRLEQANKLDPSTYASQLFDAYLAAGAAEEQKNFLFRKVEDILSYYAKAFQIAPKNGPYLSTLMGYYLELNRKDEATLLFQSIQKQPWASEFALTAKQFNALANVLSENQDSALSLKCHKKACQLAPKYKRYLYAYAHTWAAEELRAISLEVDSEEKIKRLEILIRELQELFQAGFDKIENLQLSYCKALGEAYRQLASIYLKRFLLPEEREAYSPRAILQHTKAFAEAIQKTVDCYNEALKYLPEDASLHFDKALVLDFDLRTEKELEETALQEYRLAVKYNRTNSFYRKSLAFHYGCLYDLEKQQEHEEKIRESEEFSDTYRTWYREYFSQVKTQAINPHTYPN